MTTAIRPLLVLGTRPEAIKMAPVIAACHQSPRVTPVVCFTGQHGEMFRQVADYFQIQPDFDLKVLAPNQSLAQLTARCLMGLDDAIQRAKPDCVVAQGDTTSVLAASLAAFYRQIPFVHVEAGLRTGDLRAPWPEEFNRRAASLTTTLHCAPTPGAADNLRREGICDSQIRVTGNTVIDALLVTAARERGRSSHWEQRHPYLGRRDLVLITAHRRENHGVGLDSVFRAVARLASRFTEVSFVFPVHPNPHVQRAARQHLSGIANVHLLEPLAYPEFVWLMDRSKVIVSDSGGVQEEAPSLRRPVVALRETTERMEAVEIGAVELAGCDSQRIEAAVTRLLTVPAAYAAMQVERSPFGDGRAAERIVAWILERFMPEADERLSSRSARTETPPLPPRATHDTPTGHDSPSQFTHLVRPAFESLP